MQRPRCPCGSELHEKVSQRSVSVEVVRKRGVDGHAVRRQSAADVLHRVTHQTIEVASSRLPEHFGQVDLPGRDDATLACRRYSVNLSYAVSKRSALRELQLRRSRLEL